MRPFYEIVTDLVTGADTIRQMPYGVIEVADGRFRRVLLRPLPKVVSAPGILLFGGLHHRIRKGDRLLVYYNQPRRFRNFLVLKYAVSARQSSLATVCRALEALDEIARLKGSDALLCDVSNWRISTQLMDRGGWQPHCPSRWHRHYIKRFYGQYPSPPPWLVGSLQLANDPQWEGIAAKMENALIP